jgi:hypothetical protein
LPIRGIDHGLDILDRTTKLRKNGLQKMISSAYNIHELWSVAHEQIVELRRLEIAYRDQIRDDFPLPEPLLIAFLRLYMFLGRGCNIFGPITATAFMTSLQSRRHFVYRPEEDKINGLPESNDILRTEIAFVVCFIVRQAARLRFSSLNFMEWLQRQVEADANGKMFSELSAYWIGEVFTMHHCINQIQLYCPWAVNFKKQWFKSKFSDTLASDLAAHSKVQSAYNDFESSDSDASNASSEGGRYHYPVGERRSKEIIEDMRRTERNLTEFWNNIDQEMTKENIISVRLRRFLLTRTLERTPKWVPPPPKPASGPRKQTKHLSNVPDQPGPDTLCASGYLRQLENRTQATQSQDPKEAREARKLEEKTRPLPGVAAPANNTVLPTPAAALTSISTATQIIVTAKSFSIIEAIFHHARSLGNRPKEVTWSDFVSAMVDVGTVVNDQSDQSRASELN